MSRRLCQLRGSVPTYVHDQRGRVIREQGADGYVTVTVYAGDHVLSVTRSLKPAGCDPETDAQHCRLGATHWPPLRSNPPAPL